MTVVLQAERVHAEPAAGERMPLAAFPVVDEVGAEADLPDAVVGIADVEARVEERDAGAGMLMRGVK